MKKLEQINSVLEGQNECYKLDLQKCKAETEVLEAFLDDIENETELKSLIG